MSHFSSTLQTAISALGLTLREVASTTGIDHSILSRLVTGERSPSRSNLSALFTGFSSDTMLGHDILFAHLRDEAEAAGLPADKLLLRIASEAPAWADILSPGLCSDLDLLAQEAATSPDFAALITDWATVIRSHHLALEQKVYPFPDRKPALAVAEAAAPYPSPKKARVTRPAVALPRGESQRPTA